MEQEFWMCLVENNDGMPQKRHATEQAAKTEAERLAQQEKKMVYVLKVTDCVKIANVIWEKTCEAPFEAPF